ncbi:MAG: hypothetical protein ACLU38_07515 [Dysosmobacter sp.]
MGRSLPFWKYIFPMAQERFPPAEKHHCRGILSEPQRRQLWAPAALCRRVDLQPAHHPAL